MNFFVKCDNEISLFIIKNYIKKSTMTKFEKINPHEIIKVLHIFYYCIFIFLIYFMNINFFVKCDNRLFYVICNSPQLYQLHQNSKMQS